MASRRMLSAQTRIAEELLSQRPFPIAPLVAAATLQFWSQQIDDVDKRFGANDEGEVEPVEIRVVDPTFQLIGDACRRAGDDRTDAANRDVLSDLAHRPAPIPVVRDILKRSAPRFALHVLNDLVRIELGKVDAGPTRHQRQRALGISVIAIVGDCPSSDDLRHVAGLQKGGSGSSVIEIMRHAGGAASDGLRLSGA
jgi:hypothetical protein